MLKLKETIISITNRCNLRCRMCDIPAEKTEELTTSRWEEIIKDVFSIGAQTVVFSGGEPLLREDIFELIYFVKRNRMSACLTSNGSLIDGEIARKLSKSGVDVVNISVEGPEEIHDALRGRGTFNKAIYALENLKKYKIESTIATMVSRYNYMELPYIVELAKKHRATTIRFQPFSKIFVEDISREADFFVDRKDKRKLQEIFEKIIELTDKGTISTNPVNYLRMIPAYLSGERVASQNGCSALWTSCPINAKGDVFPCWVIKNGNKHIGNLGEDSLFKLWNSEKHNYIRELILKNSCPGCMMSCYDEAFDKDERKRYLFTKFKRIKNVSYRNSVNKIIRYLSRRIAHVRLRFRFYKSYRGSLKNVFDKICGNIQRKNMLKSVNNKNEIQETLKEISLLKKKIKREISKNKK